MARLYLIPAYAHTSDALERTNYQSRIAELHRRAVETGWQMYFVGPPEGLTLRLALAFEDEARHRMAEVLVDPMSIIIAQHLKSIPGRAGRPDNNPNIFYLSSGNAQHNLLKRSLELAHASAGHRLETRPISELEHRAVIIPTLP